MKAEGGRRGVARSGTPGRGAGGRRRGPRGIAVQYRERQRAALGGVAGSRRGAPGRSLTVAVRTVRLRVNDRRDLA